MSFEKLEREINELRKQYLTQKYSNVELENIYPNVKKEKPLLFDMVCSPQCDDGVLNQVLKTMKRFSIGELTQEKASEVFGGTLVDKYVKPVIPPPP